VLDRAPRRERPSWRWLAPAMALAAGLLLMVVLRPGRPPQSPDLGIKGGPVLQVVARHGARVAPLRNGDLLAPGDELRFVALPAGQRFLLIMSIDGAGTVTVYQPFGGSQSSPIAGDRVELPGSIVLDAAPGPEHLVAFFSPVPIAASAVQSLLLQLGQGGVAGLRHSKELGVPGAIEVNLWFEKAVP
jgi:hypothetical protein